jgi:uncharacterized membrane protein YuzA (DUF378 family)
MKRAHTIDWVAWGLTIVGGLNWGLVGLFQFDLVAALLGGAASVPARVVYTLVGISAAYAAFTLVRQPAVHRAHGALEA